MPKSQSFSKTRFVAERASGSTTCRQVTDLPYRAVARLLVDEVVDLAAKADATENSHDAVANAEKVKAAEGAILRALQSFPEDADIDQVEARFRYGDKSCENV